MFFFQKYNACILLKKVCSAEKSRQNVSAAQMAALVDVDDLGFTAAQCFSAVCCPCLFRDAEKLKIKSPAAVPADDV